MLRLRSATDFERVRRDGRSYAHPLVVLIACRHPAPEAPDEQPAGTRVGYTAGRGVGNAVKRNRAKRLLRESIRGQAAHLVPGWDLILIARAAMVGVTLTQVREAVSQLLRRAHVLSTNSE